MASNVIVVRILIGLFVGILVGLTGVGGGIVLLPILTSMLGIPPIIAVGSDAAVNAITKIGAGVVHWRSGNVNWRLLGALTLGSIPGAALGVLWLGVLHATRGAGVNRVLNIAIAILLIVVPVASLYTARLARKPDALPVTRTITPAYGLAIIGFVVGLLVGVTSIGSGTVALLLLLIFFAYAPTTIIGTDVVHGFVLTAFTSVLQMKLGNVDYSLVGYILIGSIPGGIIGAYLTNYIPSHRLKQALFAMLVVFGMRMLWEGLANG